MSAQLTQRDSLDAEPALAPQEPPPWVIRWTAWLLIAAFLCGLLIAIVMRLPETVDCRFVLIPATGADPIQAPRQAIVSRVVVEEGQPVKPGDELYVLRSDEIGGWDTCLARSTKTYGQSRKASTETRALSLHNLELKARRSSRPKAR